MPAPDFTGCGKMLIAEGYAVPIVPAPDFLAAASISPGERVFKPAETLVLEIPGFSPGGCFSRNSDIPGPCPRNCRSQKNLLPLSTQPQNRTNVEIGICFRPSSTTGLLGLAPASSTRASAAHHRESIGTRLYDDFGVANNNVSATDHTCPQPSCAPRGRLRRARTACDVPGRKSHVMERVRSVRPLDWALLTTWTTPRPA